MATNNRIHPSLPPASKLILLNGISAEPAGTCVRVLGCIDTFDIARGILSLADGKSRHRRAGAPVHDSTVECDFSHIAEQLEKISRGDWVNIIGYVQPKEAPYRLQAVSLWSAGAVNYDTYEKAASRRQIRH